MTSKDDARHASEISDLVGQLEEKDSWGDWAEERIEALSRVLLDVEGSLLAYWTDISQEEIQRLLPLIRETLGDYEPESKTLPSGAAKQRSEGG